MMCDISTPGGCSEVWDRPQRVHLILHRSNDSDRLVNEEARVGDDQDREDELQAAREAWAPPEIRERKGTEDQEEQDQDPHRAVVPLGRGRSFRRGHGVDSARPGVNAPEEDNDQ